MPRKPRLSDPAEVGRLYETGLSIERIAALRGVSPQAVRTALVSAGIPFRPRSFYAGERCGQWKGGRTKHSSGYILIFRPEHPRAGENGYVLEHIVVAEEHIGAPVPEGYDVHHKNHIKDDNRPENLIVLLKAEHTRLHAEEKRQAATA